MQQYVRPQTLHRARLGLCSCGGVLRAWRLPRSLHFGHQVRCKVHGRGVAYSLVKALLSRECLAKSAPTDDITRHTGAARITRLRMRPMSLFETGHATGAISLAALLAGEPARSQESTLTVTDLATLVVIGGWPGNLTRTSAQAMQAARDYLDALERVMIIEDQPECAWAAVRIARGARPARVCAGLGCHGAALSR